MRIKSTIRASVPKPDSPARKVSHDPAIGVVAGSDVAMPADLEAGPTVELPDGQKLVTLKPDAIGQANYDKLIGKKLTLTELGIATAEHTLAGVSLPDGADTAFEVAALVVSGASTYHAFTRADANGWDQTISSIKTATLLADLIAPAVPQLAQYQPALKGLTLLLKSVKTYDDVIQLEMETE